eukprot:TRINITY_DN1365_c0_g1_i2.p2 TRINITY_DN1365_c0_g1~~TRINITY_DN1365_c0_g1_i2.p2  ORF type:complete len:114 (-),score=0.15 TRINITY_DN1365_c0_g1_i2:105-446(-)
MGKCKIFVAKCFVFTSCQFIELFKNNQLINQIQLQKIHITIFKKFQQIVVQGWFVDQLWQIMILTFVQGTCEKCKNIVLESCYNGGVLNVFTLLLKFSQVQVLKLWQSNFGIV